MRAYEAGTAAYFATPPVNLVYAFHASLLSITKGSTSLEQRFAQHRAASSKFKKAVEAAGLKQLPKLSADGKGQANGMTAVRLFVFCEFSPLFCFFGDATVVRIVAFIYLLIYFCCSCGCLRDSLCRTFSRALEAKVSLSQAAYIKTVKVSRLSLMS